MEKASFLKSIRYINKKVKSLKIIDDLIESFRGLKNYFINNPIFHFKEQIVHSFKFTRDLLKTITYDSKDMYPDYVVNLKSHVKILVEFGNNLDLLDNDELVDIAEFNCLCTLFCCTVSIEFPLDDDSYENYKKILQKDNNYFRGHSDSAYELIPSIYRKLKTNKNILKNDFVLEKYKEYGYYQKYIKLFNNDKEKDVDYEMMSFIQHSAAYSPLLDITSNIDIATIFACSCGVTNPNEYEDKDASIYIFMFQEEASGSDEDLNIHWIPTKLTFKTEIKPGKPLFTCSPRDFETKYSVKTEYTNDRMKYQKGAFLFFNECFIVNGHLLIPFQQIITVKIDIPKQMKKALYKSLVKQNNFYSLSYLLEPYEFISDFLSDY